MKIPRIRKRKNQRLLKNEWENLEKQKTLGTKNGAIPLNAGGSLPMN